MSATPDLSTTIVQALRRQGGALSSAELQTQLRVSRAASPADYPALAEAAMQGSIGGSSAGGEQPKFCTIVGGDAHQPGNTPDGAARHVLVKFFPARSGPNRHGVAHGVRRRIRGRHGQLGGHRQPHARAPAAAPGGCPCSTLPWAASWCPAASERLPAPMRAFLQGLGRLRQAT